MGKVISINISVKKGVAKHPIEKGVFKLNYGLQGDAHAGSWHRQVSLLGVESIEKIKASGETGICQKKFIENITTEGIILYKLSVGNKIKVGNAAFEITQIGKECYIGCENKQLKDDCIMQREVVFARVITEGSVKVGDAVQAVL